MGSPDTQGPRMPKPHPACPGWRRCRISGCIHNAPSRFSTDETISVDLFGGKGMLGEYPSVRLFNEGWLYERLDAVSKRMDIGGAHDKENATIENTVPYLAQTKVREVSGIVLERIRSWLDSEMAPV